LKIIARSARLLSLVASVSEAIVWADVDRFVDISRTSVLDEPIALSRTVTGSLGALAVDPD